MIPTTPFEIEILRRVQAGELCPTVLAHGDLCGRELYETHRVGMCRWHSEEFLCLPHHGDGDDENSKACTRCKRRAYAYRASLLCATCQRAVDRELRRNAVVQGHVVAL